jgi:hypothetical protein
MTLIRIHGKISPLSSSPAMAEVAEYLSEQDRLGQVD